MGGQAGGWVGGWVGEERRERGEGDGTKRTTRKQCILLSRERERVRRQESTANVSKLHVPAAPSRLDQDILKSTSEPEIHQEICFSKIKKKKKKS